MKSKAPKKASYKHRIKHKIKSARRKAVQAKELTKLAVRNPRATKRAIDKEYPIAGAALGIAGTLGLLYATNKGPELAKKLATHGSGRVANFVKKRMGTWDPPMYNWSTLSPYWKRQYKPKMVDSGSGSIYNILDRKGRVSKSILMDTG